jgi:hypothetical protein
MEKAIGWSDSWELFVEELERRVQHGVTTEELTHSFAGAPVKWTGVIEQLDVDELAPGVDVALPAKTIIVDDEAETLLDGVSLPIADSAVDEWRVLKTGMKVTFRATFVESSSIFPPIEIKTLDDGPIITMIRLTNATLIRVHDSGS